MIFQLRLLGFDLQVYYCIRLLYLRVFICVTLRESFVYFLVPTTDD